MSNLCRSHNCWLMRGCRLKTRPLRIHIGAWLALLLFFPVSWQTLAAPPPSSSGEGRLVIEFEPAQLRIHVDGENLSRPELRLQQLPPFESAYLGMGQQMYPVRPGPLAADHPHWEYLPGPGRLENDGLGRRMRLPLALQQRNANCVHNGLLEVEFPPGESSGRAQFTVAAETCLYFKFDLRAEGRAYFVNESLADGVAVHGHHYRDAQLPVKPFDVLAAAYPGIDLPAFANPAVDPGDLSVYGLVIDGVHYLGGCETRNGSDIPCEEWVLPSYSTAKSIFAGLTLMRLEKLYPGVGKALIADFVPACSDWGEVTFADALNMATGRFDSAVHGADEMAPRNDSEFHYRESHAEKIEFSCHAYSRRANPGQRFVYHTTDTYVLGTAMQAFLRTRRGGDADIFDDILQPLLRELRLSPVTEYPKRTYDDSAQPWVGWGMNFLPGDVAKLGSALAGGYFESEDRLDTDMIDDALQHHQGAGLVADKVARYSNGFFAQDLSLILNCDKQTWMPFLMGYGGIRIAILPRGMTYYYFSDGGVFDWKAPLRALHAVQPLC